MSQNIYSSLEELVLEKDYAGALNLLNGSGREDILSTDLHNGDEIVKKRSEGMDIIVKGYFTELIDKLSEIGRVTILANGSYGRKELTPASDNDITIITDFNADEKSEVDGLMANYVKPSFSYGLFYTDIAYQPLETIPQLDIERYCSLMDGRFLLGEKELFFEAKNSLKRSVNLNRFIRRKLSELDASFLKFPEEVNNVAKFEIKQGIGGLRNAMTGVWLEGIKNYEPALEVYERLPKDFYDATRVLLKLRSWNSLNSEHGDLILNEDFLRFKEYFGGDSAHRVLLDSRKIIKNYVSEIRHQILERGVAVNDYINFTESGLKVDIDSILRPPLEVFYGVMSISQKERLQLSRSLKQAFTRTAKDNIFPSEDFLKLFREEGSLYSTLMNLASMDVLDNLIEGYSKLETSHYQRDHRNFHITRDEKALRNIERLEKLESIEDNEKELSKKDIQKRFFKEVYQDLSPDRKSTVKLHLLCQDIPKITGQTSEEFYGSLKEKYNSSDLLNIDDLIFMNNHKRYIVDVAREMIVTEDSTIESVVEEIRDIDRMKMLMAFTYAHYDYGEKEKLEGRNWQSMILLYENVRKYLEQSDEVPYNVYFFDEEQIKVLEKIPRSFFRSDRVNDSFKLKTWMKYIMKAIQNKDKREPQVVYSSGEENELELAVLYEDYPGSLTRITGTCYEYGIDIKQASGAIIDEPYNLSMDFLKIKIPEELIGSRSKDQVLSEEEIEARRMFIDRFECAIKKNVGEAKEFGYEVMEIIKDISPRYNLDNFGRGRYNIGIRFKVDKPGILYSFTKILSNEGEIRGFKTYTHSNREVTDSFTLVSNKNEEEIRNGLDQYLERK